MHYVTLKNPHYTCSKEELGLTSESDIFVAGNIIFLFPFLIKLDTTNTGFLPSAAHMSLGSKSQS